MGERLPPPYPGHTVDLGRHVLHVRHAPGDVAQTAVLVHGLGGAATNWTDLSARLQPDIDVHAVDLPGHGRSPAPRDGRYDIDAHVAAVVAYVEHLGRGPVHVFGNSTGGVVATRLAATRPELVRSLSLVSPAMPVYGLSRSSDPRLALLLVPGLAGAVMRRVERATPEERVRRTLELCFADLSRVPPQRLAEAEAEMRRRASLPWALPSFVATLRGLVRSYFEPGARNPWAQAATVQAPTLLVFGERDRLVPTSVARRAARTYPHGHLHLLPDVGHVAMMEVPDEVARLAREHLLGSARLTA